MADDEQINVRKTDNDTEEIEKNRIDEKIEGKESKEGENEEDEVKEEVPVRKDSTLERFLGWFRGKPKQELHEEEEDDDDEEEEEEEKEEDKEKKNKEESETKEKEETESETNKDVSEQEKEKETEILIINEHGIEQEREKEQTHDISAISQVKQPASRDRTLLIIEEEGKSDKKVAPLAEAEEEEIEEPSVSRTSIDRPVIEPKKAEAVEAERETTEKEALPQDDIDSKAEKRKSATVFLQLSQPKFERHSEDDGDRRDERASEHNDRITYQHTLVAEQQEAPKNNDRKSKMEEIIVEKRHEDRTESMQETWKKVEEMEPNKTYRVSYKITTTTIQKSDKLTDKPDEEEDDEKLFGEHILLADSKESKPKHEGPPPADLEPEFTYEEAKKEEAGTADIDKMFEMMANEGSPPEGGVTTESTKRQEESEEIPRSPEDIFRKLHNWDKEPTDWWTSTKKKRDYEEWMKPMKEGTIRRVIIPKVEIPYDACVRFVTDWKHREEWDKTFSEIKILKDSKESKLIYCPVKKRDLAFETLDRQETDPPCYVMTWKRKSVDKEGHEVEVSAGDKKQLQLVTHTCGIILRPSESGDQATYIAILCQLEGPIDNALKNTYMAGHPKSWLRNLNKYYKKQQKGAQKKVVYL